MFVVFEGVDDVGKSTHCQLLTDWLRKEHKVEVHLTCEPSKSRLGRTIRGIFESSEEWKPAPYLAHLFATNRYQHLYAPDGIISHLNRGKVVICDRYIYSSLVYQNSCQDLVRELNKNFLRPHVLIYLESTSLSTEATKLAKKYHKLPEFKPDYSCWDIDRQETDTVQAGIRKIITKKLKYYKKI